MTDEPLRVYAYPADAWGCGAYRVKWPAMAVSADTRFDVTIVEPDARRVSMEIDQRTGRLVREHFPADADLVVMQRPTNRFLAEVIGRLQARGVAVVVDMDDDLTCIDPRNPAHRALGRTVTGRHRDRVTGAERLVEVPNMHYFAHATAACRAATWVTVTTVALADKYGAHGRVSVLPNMVPRWYLDVGRVDSDLIGWGGSVHSHPDDLQQVGPALARLTQHGHRFETVGDPAGVARALGLSADPDGPGPVALHEWPLAIARFGIGIAPLAATRFNDAKSWLKPLEYAAVGVPAVASPRADYRRLADLGGCITVDKPRAWETALRHLAAHPAQRDELSEAGRAVAAQLTLEGNAWRWAEVWEQAVKVQRQKVPAGAA